MEMRVPLRTFSHVLHLLTKILYWDIRNYDLLLKPQFFLQTLLNFVSITWNQLWKTLQKPIKSELETKQEPIPFTNCEGLISRGDINMVMDKLGIQHFDPQADDSFVGNDEILSLFDNEEVSLDELKVAFDVFDENRDGFIDVKELHRVLRKLGQQEKTDFGECKAMISDFDENGDGFIDFDEFIGLMEKCSF